MLSGRSVEMAYYGTTLADWSSGRENISVSMGGKSTKIEMDDADELKFISSVMEEFVLNQGVDEQSIDVAIASAEDNIVPMDNFIGRRVVGLLRMVERLSPAKGAILLRAVKQGHTYLSSPKAARSVEDIVRPLLKKNPCVLITHSLGTVIAFKLLREMEREGVNINIPLLITMGSPLGLEAFKAKLGPPRRKPSGVGEWKNFFDPSDIVTLGKALNEDNFSSGITNDGTVDNETSNAHGVIGYLPHSGVGQAIRSVLNKCQVDNSQ